MQHYIQTGRGNWSFTYTAGQLAYGAQKQKEYREERVRIWKALYAQQEEELRSKGITISTSVAAAMSISSTYLKGGQSAGARIQIDPELERKVLECESKVKEHERLRDEYEGWIQTLSAQQDKELEVTQQDFLYFFLNVKDIPGVDKKSEATWGVPTERLAVEIPQVQVASLRPASAKKVAPANPLSPMTAPPLALKAGEKPMLTVPSLGPAAANVFVPPDFGDDTPEVDSNWPSD